MTEEELRNLAASVEELKRAVKKNNPQLRAFMSPEGWVPMSLIAGVGTALFCLPAQILTSAYGSFDKIPPAYSTALWCVLALVVVLSSVWKLVLFVRKGRDVSTGDPDRTALSAFVSSRSVHIVVPYFLVIATSAVFLSLIGHPWYIASVTAIATCFWSNYVSTQVDRPKYTVAGWWTLVTGLVSLFFVERAPFIWIFVIYGGLCFVFAVSVMLSGRRDGKHAE